MKETSLTAFCESRSAAEKHRNIILEVLKKENKPMSSLQISVKCKLTHQQVWKRMSELENDGKVKVSNQKAKNPSGKSVSMYVLPTSQMELFN